MATLKGTKNKDKLKGTNNDDTIIGKGDNDELWGKDGDDLPISIARRPPLVGRRASATPRRPVHWLSERLGVGAGASRPAADRQA